MKRRAKQSHLPDRLAGQTVQVPPAPHPRPSLVVTHDGGLASWAERAGRGECRLISVSVGRTNAEWVLNVFWPDSKITVDPQPELAI